MPDPTVEQGLAEAYALAPQDDVIVHTLELRHRAFVDAAGNPDSVWLTTDEGEISATIEDDAPIRAGETVDFVSFAFRYKLAPVETSATPELEVVLDAIDRNIIEQLDRAAADIDKIVLCYRPYLASDLTELQMNPPPTFTLSNVKTDLITASARARVDIDLNGKFPSRLYTATEFAALIGR